MFKDEAKGVDFTMVEYCSLLRLAKSGGYRFCAYTALPLNERSVLWRHDIDMSLNRAVRMAEVEAEEGVSSTFFIYLHSEFYNVLEAGQLRLAKRLVELGGRIGLHFNPTFHNIANESELEYWIKKEADVLTDLLKVEVAAFSFHDTNPFILSCEKSDYGGLVNCYSSYFKKEVSYCSDSNGIWAYQRLRDVLQKATEPRLHVLTHPEWWQETAMEPREKVFRSADGRARKVVGDYVNGVAAFGRPDNYSMGNAFSRLESLFPTRGDALEALWLRGERVAVFLDVWRVFDRGVFASCNEWFTNVLGASQTAANRLLASELFRLRSHVFLSLINGDVWSQILGGESTQFLEWRLKRDALVYGAQENLNSRLDKGVVFMVGILSRLLEFTQTGSATQIRPAMPATVGVKTPDGDILSQWLESNASAIGLSTSLQPSHP